MLDALPLETLTVLNHTLKAQEVGKTYRMIKLNVCLHGVLQALGAIQTVNCTCQIELRPKKKSLFTPQACMCKNKCTLALQLLADKRLRHS